jgi:hypothetical protein
MNTKSNFEKSQVHRIVHNVMISFLILILAFGFVAPMETAQGLGSNLSIKASNQAQHSPDANTVLLDAFDGITIGEEHGTVSYAPSLPGLGQAVDLDLGDWIKYTVPSWNNQYGTIEAWIYPDTYKYSIAMLQWYNTNTVPPAGYVGQFTLLIDGHLWWKSWGPPWPSNPNPISNSIIPLGEWTHVAVTWSPAGTRLYVNGMLDYSTTKIWMPALNPTTYVYLNGWGLHDHGLMDEFRISNVARSEEEIRAYVVEILNSPPVSDPNGPYIGAVGSPILFDGSASFDPDGDELTYAWEFGDGSPIVNGVNPSHVYDTVGIYDVCLTVNDGYVNSEQVCTMAVVYDPDGGFVTGGGWIDSPEGAYYPSDLPYFDGSYYEIFFSDEELNFFEARDVVAGMTYNSCGSAHLATVTSQGEYETVLGLFDDWPGSVLGGYQDEGIYPPDAGWQWVTGEPFEFETTLDWWLPGEPNDCGPSPSNECVPASEQVLEMYPDGWNDVPFYEPRNLFMVEYEDCYQPTGKATFGFVSKYKKGASVPTGNTEFQFKAGDLNFHGSVYDWLVVTGSNYAKFKGTGSINGEGTYKFHIWAGDGTGDNGEDTFRIKIWYEEGGSEVMVYDNGMDQEIGGGSIVVHKAK